MEPTEVRIDKAWLGPGEGNRLRLTHVPTGVTVLGEPGVVVDDESFEVERARLLEELERKLEGRGPS